MNMKPGKCPYCGRKQVVQYDTRPDHPVLNTCGNPPLSGCGMTFWVRKKESKTGKKGVEVEKMGEFYRQDFPGIEKLGGRGNG